MLVLIHGGQAPIRLIHPHVTNKRYQCGKLRHDAVAHHALTAHGIALGERPETGSQKVCCHHAAERHERLRFKFFPHFILHGLNTSHRRRRGGGWREIYLVAFTTCCPGIPRRSRGDLFVDTREHGVVLAVYRRWLVRIKYCCCLLGNWRTTLAVTSMQVMLRRPRPWCGCCLDATRPGPPRCLFIAAVCSFSASDLSEE